MSDFQSLFKNIDPGISKELASGSSPECSDPIFTIKDLKTAENEPAKIVRWWFIKNNIGFKKFNELHRKLASASGMRADEADRDRGNTRKGLQKDKLTWDFLVSHILPLLGLSLVNLILVTKDEKGDTISTSSLDVNEQIPKDFDEKLNNVSQMLLNTKTADGFPVKIDSADIKE